jgi:hypothetical protein
MLKAIIPRIHDAPWLSIRDVQTFSAFCLHYSILPHASRDTRIIQIAQAFSQIPYENLTKILKANSVVSTSSAIRDPDECLKNYLEWGTGGTCFSLTGAMVAVFDALGIEAYPILADRHYGSDTHCGLVCYNSAGQLLLLDPGFLLCKPVIAPQFEPISFDNGFNRTELVPRNAGLLVELHTIVKNNRKHRLTFKMTPVSDGAFRLAWEQSFAFEMMTYPVSTRVIDGAHHYLQGNMLSIRNAEKNIRIKLSSKELLEYMSGSLGIRKDITTKALEIVDYGKSSTATNS